MFGKTQPIRTKFGIRGHVKGWQRNFGRDRRILGKMGAGTSPAERELFCVVNQATFPATSQRPIFTKFGHETYFSVPLRNPERRYGNFHVRGHLPPKIWNRKSVKTGTSLGASYRSRDAMQRNIVYSTFVVQGQGVSEIGQLFSTTYCTAAELQGIKVAKFSDFVQFSP